MKSQILGLRVASAIFGLVCLGQLLRIVLDLKVLIGSIWIHRWASGVAGLIAGGLCLWLWRLAACAEKPPQ